ncbi:TetR/AcrR family transcriptional regulator [Tissierella praeacuta]|uniref:TetR/AcrR family transcriptional regulator n=1 Tax=Tissierella praeacuta TaxID=43131 RepID=UPI0033410698
MKRQIEGVAEQILECAEIEFLEKGFMDASLRDIAKSCGVSTSSIYTRFVDKAGLFEAVVSPVINELKLWYVDKQEEFHQADANIQVRDMFLYSNDKINFFLDYLYDNFTIFKLLTTKSEGTKYSTFINDFVEMDVEYTLKFVESIGSDVISSRRITPELLHILSSAMYAGIFETVIHDMSKEDARTHVKKLRRFFVCGWKDIFDNSDIK